MMTEGLITRIGKWIDRKWEAKTTWRDLQDQESKCSERHIGVLGLIAGLENATAKDKLDLQDQIKAASVILERRIVELQEKLKALDSGKELADLKTRMEKMELYSGMTRKVDPTKPAVAKSAFSM